MTVWISMPFRNGPAMNFACRSLPADATVVYVGGAVISDVFSGPHVWRETRVAVCAPVVNDGFTLLAANWRCRSCRPRCEPAGTAACRHTAHPTGTFRFLPGIPLSAAAISVDREPAAAGNPGPFRGA